MNFTILWTDEWGETIEAGTAEDAEKIAREKQQKMQANGDLYFTIEVEEE